MNQRVLVTGGASGIGRRLAERFAARATGLRTWVGADDMALFLASPAAGKVTGQFLAVDGHTESMV